jgi:hypothetical protein
VLGSGLEDWPGEKWLDVRQIDTLAPIMRSRLDLCKSKGFDAVEADHVDGYSNSSGFPLSAEDQLRYNRFLASKAHARGLSIGLKTTSTKSRSCSRTSTSRSASSATSCCSQANSPASWLCRSA